MNILFLTLIIFLPIVFWVIYGHFLGALTIEKVKMEPGNRMLRIGLGQNQSRWFIRIDAWFFGIRVT